MTILTWNTSGQSVRALILDQAIQRFAPPLTQLQPGFICLQEVNPADWSDCLGDRKECDWNPGFGYYQTIQKARVGSYAYDGVLVPWRPTTYARRSDLVLLWNCGHTFTLGGWTDYRSTHAPVVWASAASGPCVGCLDAPADGPDLYVSDAADALADAAGGNTWFLVGDFNLDSHKLAANEVLASGQQTSQSGGDVDYMMHAPGIPPYASVGVSCAYVGGCRHRQVRFA